MNTEQADLAAYFAQRGVPPCDREELAQESFVVVWNCRVRIQLGKEQRYFYGVA